MCEVRQQTGYCECRHGLARTGVSDETQYLAGPYVELKVIKDLNRCAVRVA